VLVLLQLHSANARLHWNYKTQSR